MAAAPPLASAILVPGVSSGGCAVRSLRATGAQDMQAVWGREHPHSSWIPVNHLSAGLAGGECLSYTHSPLWPPHRNQSQGHGGRTGMAAPPLPDGPMQGCVQGPQVAAAGAETREGSALWPARASTFPANSPGLLDELLSTPELQDQGEALLSGYLQEEEPAGFLDPPLTEEEYQALLDML